jgi:preprotein translocase subunit YajC
VAFIVVLVVMLVVMYFLMIRPQRAKQRQAQDMINRVGPGDEIITIGGIYGDVVEVMDDRVVVEIAEDVHIEVAKRAIGSVVPQELEEAEVDESADGSAQWGAFEKAESEEVEPKSRQ